MSFPLSIQRLRPQSSVALAVRASASLRLVGTFHKDLPRSEFPFELVPGVFSLFFN